MQTVDDSDVSGHVPRIGFRSGPRGSGGSAFVELAMVVMFLFLILLGTVELTFLLLDSNQLYKAIANTIGAMRNGVLDPTGATLPVTAPAALCQGQTLEQMAADLVKCGECPCPSTVGAAPEVNLAYCNDHDHMIYLNIRASYSRPFSTVMTRVLGSGTTLTADTLMRIPASSNSGLALLRCAP